MTVEEQPTVWINVTTSANWHRPAVGIVRVERELRDNLRKLYPSGMFKECIWTGVGFVEFGNCSQDADSAVHEGSAGQAVQLITGEPMYLLPVIPRRQALMSIAQGTLSLAPARFRPMLDGLMRRSKTYAVKAVNVMVARRIRKQIKAASQQPAVGSKKTGTAPALTNTAPISHPFSPGDVFITVGLDWNWTYYKEFYGLRTRDKIKVVACCYDLIPVLYPQYCVGEVANLFTSYFLDVAEGSDLVLCISKQTESDLHEMLERTGGRQVKTHVFPLGDNVPGGTGEVSKAVEEVLAKPFILFVSSIERRKNHEVLYRAYHLLCKEGKRDHLPKLVFVGMPGWGVGDLLKDIELDPLTKDLIVQLHHVTDSELLELYKAALFCVFPSLYEGWGLPIGEALSLGKVVIASNRGSIPEVGGELVEYLDPWDVQVWAEKLRWYFANPDEVMEREKNIRSRYISKTWDETASSVLAAAKSIKL